MLPELSARLSEIIEQKRLKNKLEQDLRAVENELQDQSARFESLMTQLEKEKVDVEKLERINLTTLFYSVLGSREQQLEKERQDLLTAQLLYQQSKHQVAFLEQERNSLLQQLDKLADVESQYDLLFSEKEHLLHQSNPAVANQLFDVSEPIADLNVEVKELAEAITAGNRVISSLEQVIGSLESAKSWGTWDMLGGDFIATAIKHSKIDDARNGIYDIQAKISQLTRELADVQRSVELQIDISELAYFADFFLDDLIFDWIVQSKIINALEQSKKAKDIIFQAVKELERLKDSTQKKNNDLQDRRTQLIENT